jgi:hypothetical protein
MYECLPPDLPRLRTIERFLLLALEDVRMAIGKAEQAQAERAARRPPPEPPAWILATGRAPSVRGTAPPQTVHVGGCGMTEGGSTRAISREQALRALAVDGIPACAFCRPDRDLDVQG